MNCGLCNKNQIKIGAYLCLDCASELFGGAEANSAVDHVVSQPGVGEGGGPEIIGVVELRAINILLKTIDDLVHRNVIDSRSAIADARLNCCEPFTYFDGVE